MKGEPIHREKQLRTIENCIRLAGKGIHEHLFIYGPAGSGRTFCILYALSKYKSKMAYVDCSTYKTRAAIITKILIDFGIPVPRRGVPLDYIYEKMVNFFQNQKGAIVVLDDAHKINRNDMEVFNNLLGLNDTTGRISLIVISTDDSLLDSLSRMTTFLPSRVFFQPYEKNHLIDILKQETSVASEVLEPVADYVCVHNGNCRLALECMNKINQRPEGINLSSTLKFLNELKY